MPQDSQVQDTENHSAFYPDSPSTYETTLLFQGHLLQPSATNPILRTAPVADWITLVLIISLAYFTALNFFGRKILKQFVSAWINNSVTNQLVRDENILVQRNAVLFSVLYYVLGGLFLYLLSDHFHWQNSLKASGFGSFFMFTFVLAMFYSFKLLIVKTIGFLVEADRQASAYIFNQLLINNGMALMLLPLLLLLIYSPMAWKTGIIFFSILLTTICSMYLVIRGILIWLDMRNRSLYYLILYICALEIAPLLIIFKLASAQR